MADNRFALDPALAAAADLASVINATDALAAESIAVWAFADAGWLANLTMNACMMGVSLGQALASMLPRLHTGYNDKDTRNAADYGMYCVGAKVGKRRTPVAEARVAREAVILYGAVA